MQFGAFGAALRAFTWVAYIVVIKHLAQEYRHSIEFLGIILSCTSAATKHADMIIGETLVSFSVK
jgi:hypothetical protein